jgi:uncharacterized protein YgiB involved in biofilm formation
LIRRRRSALLGLSALSLSVGAAGCERQAAPVEVAEQPMPVYASAAECAGVEEKSVCEAAFAKAAAEHDQTAPKFASRADCEAHFDSAACEPRRTEGGGSVFMPMMMGMMMGQMMSGRVGHPVYTDRAGATYSGSTRVAEPRSGFGAGSAGLPRTVTAPMTQDGAIAPRGATLRGGFGQSSSYRGSAGS